MRCDPRANPTDPPPVCAPLSEHAREIFRAITAPEPAAQQAMRAVLLSALFASVAAFAPPTALVPRVVDAPLTKALVLRGGGVISKV